MPSPELTPGSRGYIIPIGGAEDKVSAKAILKRFAHLCGGTDAVIAVVPTASVDPETPDRYRRVFAEVGVRNVKVLDVQRREDATAATTALLDATGVFLTGGAQLRLSTLLGGTDVARLLRRMNALGVHVAGTSAGAAFLSEHMIAFGKEGGSPLAGQATLVPGLGLTNRVIVDQHFRQRDRMGRLLSSLAYNPFAIGLGLDEDTAAFIGPDNKLEVVGSGAITVVDAGGLEHSSMATVDEGKPVEMIGVRLHVLVEGSRFDLHARRAFPAPEPRPHG
ncbi:MAG: cyanophycinase [Pseudomonadota bacterium]|nr:cyanophycinase [Pseudomonadota bacterium]